MNKTPLITVAMVSYNSAEYVSTVLESVLNSSYQNLELLIVDDNSTDTTWKLITEYHDPRIKAHQNENNLGEYNNRNKAIKLSVGEYLIFIDGDDYLYPHELICFIEAAEVNANASLIISRPENDHMFYPVVLSPDITFKYEYFGNGLLSHGFASMLFKADYLKNTGFSTEFVSGDTYIKHLLGFKYPIILTHAGVSWWRRTPSQASSTIITFVKGLEEATKIKLIFLEKYKKFLSEREYRMAKKRLAKPIFRRLINSVLNLRIEEGKSLLYFIISENLSLWSLFFTQNNKYQKGTSINPIGIQ